MYWIPTCGRSGKGCSAVPCFGRASLIPPVADAPGWYGPDPTKLKTSKNIEASRADCPRPRQAAQGYDTSPSYDAEENSPANVAYGPAISFRHSMS